MTSVTGTGYSWSWSGIVGEQVVDASDAAAPEVLELGEHRCDRAHRVDLAVGELLAAVASFAEQAGPFEHGDVLLHRGERHVVARGKCGDRVLSDEHASQDVAAGAVGQGVEQGVGPVLVPAATTMTNNIQPIGCMSSSPERLRMSPRTSSVLPPTRSRQCARRHPEATLRLPAGSSVAGSASSSRIRSASSSCTISGCATRSAGRFSTVDGAAVDVFGGRLARSRA